MKDVNDGGSQSIQRETEHQFQFALSFEETIAERFFVEPPRERSFVFDQRVGVRVQALSKMKDQFAPDLLG